MIPHYARVAALDDNQEHLQMIVRGLGKAGFWAMPIWFDAGVFEPELPVPLPGIRLIFTDIHMGAGPLSNSAIFASNIINGLKKIVGKGPYGLIFWSQYPDEAETVWSEILARAPAAQVPPPLGYGIIDKGRAFDIGVNENHEFDSDNLRKLILEQVGRFKTLAVAMSWDERVARAAIDATNRLYEIAITANATDPTTKTDETAWSELLAFLAQEAVGRGKAIQAPIMGLDNALLPLLEDQLFRRSNNIESQEGDLGQIISDALSQSEKNLKRPTKISATALNTHYLIDEVNAESSKMWERGMVTKLEADFLNSDQFANLFGGDVDWILKNEFILSESKTPIEEIRSKGLLHLVELSAECDQVQEKVATHRYLLALWMPAELMGACKNSRGNHANDSIKSIGEVELKNSNRSHHLLVSCRRFMTLPPGKSVAGTCLFRLRRDVVDELTHYYTTYSRRPGVLRFF